MICVVNDFNCVYDWFYSSCLGELDLLRTFIVFLSDGMIGIIMWKMEMEHGKLFVGGISWDTTEERLRAYFQTFGEVVEAVIMKDRTTGRARGFGFVVFADPSVAERVVKEKHMIDGRTVSSIF